MNPQRTTRKKHSCCRRFYHINEVILKPFPSRCDNEVWSRISKHVHSLVFHFISPTRKLVFTQTVCQMHCVTQTDCEGTCVCLTVCVPKRQAHQMGFSWEPESLCLLLCTSVLDPPGWQALLWPKRSILCLISSVYYISLYQSCHPFQDHRGSSNQTRTTRRNSQLYRQNLKGWMNVYECVWKRKRDSSMWSADICCRPLQSWNVILCFTQRAWAHAAGSRRPLNAPLHGGNTRMKWLYRCPTHAFPSH